MFNVGAHAFVLLAFSVPLAKALTSPPTELRLLQSIDAAGSIAAVHGDVSDGGSHASLVPPPAVQSGLHKVEQLPKPPAPPRPPSPKETVENGRKAQQRASQPRLVTEPRLGGTTVPEINATFYKIVIFMIAITALGHLCGGCLPTSQPGAVFGLLLGSYMLIPSANITTLFSFNILFGFHPAPGLPMVQRGLTSDSEGNVGPVTESTLGFVKWQWESGGYIGSCLVILYAWVVPAVKLFLLAWAEFFRNSEEVRQAQVARTCIKAVRAISKWACPDMFAYIMLLYLLRELHHPPRVVSAAQLDVGFIYFSVFCICSTISSLAIKLPELPSVTAEGRPTSPVATTPEGALVADQASTPVLVKLHGKGLAIPLVGTLCLGFCLAMGIGMFSPCMAFRIHTESINAPPYVKSQLLDAQHELNSDVSITAAARAFHGYLAAGEMSVLLAIIMIEVFVVMLPVLDMLMLFFVSLSFPDMQQKKVVPHFGSQALYASQVLNKLQMLDVFIFGIILAVICGSKVYTAFSVDLRTGIVPLVVAASLHYATFVLVTNAAKYSSAK